MFNDTLPLGSFCKTGASMSNRLCPLCCVQQLLCILQPVLPSCGTLRVHALKINRKNKGMFSTVSLFHLLLACHSQERDGRLESPVALESFLLLIISWFCPLLSKPAENPACHNSKVLPQSKRSRSCWALILWAIFSFAGKPYLVVIQSWWIEGLRLLLLLLFFFLPIMKEICLYLVMSFIFYLNLHKLYVLFSVIIKVTGKRLSLDPLSPPKPQEHFLQYFVSFQ